MLRAFTLSIIATCFTMVSPALAQRQVQTESRSGTIKEVQEKGRSRTLLVTLSDGEELSVSLSPKVNLEVKLSGGDISALQPGVFIMGTGVLTNEKVFLDEATVYLTEPRQRLPASQIAPLAGMPDGQSVNARQVSGQIVARQTSADYPEYEQFALKTPQAVPMLMAKQDVKVDVVSKNPDDLKPDQTIELEVIVSRSKRITVVKATVDGGEYTPPAAEATDEK